MAAAAAVDVVRACGVGASYLDATVRREVSGAVGSERTLRLGSVVCLFGAFGMLW